LLFVEPSLFSEVFGRARDVVQCNSIKDTISVEGVLHYSKYGRIFKRLVPIECEGEWEKYVKIIMKNEFQCLDLFVRRSSIDFTPHVYSPPNRQSPAHGFLPEHENPALLILRYPTLRWMWQIQLRSLMLNPPRMRLGFVLVLVHNVGLLKRFL
jgi:hypothetical protein